MAVWVLMFDMRAPDFGAPRGELYRAALDMAAWADERVFRQGRWHFDEASDDLRTLHHVVGGQFIVAGRTVQG